LLCFSSQLKLDTYFMYTNKPILQTQSTPVGETRLGWAIYLFLLSFVALL
jgi:hypothetical protein